MTKGQWGFCLGLGLGFGIGILLAPNSGRETRSRIRDEAADGLAYIKQTGADIRENAEDLVKQGTDAIAQRVEGVQSALKAGKHAYDEATTT